MPIAASASVIAFAMPSGTSFFIVATWSAGSVAAKLERSPALS
jgi:hypothetical protein